MKNLSFLFLAVLPILAFTACGDDKEEEESFEVTPASVSMHYEDTKQLSALGATSWMSEDEFVATVDDNGLVTGGHVGTTKIIASNGKQKASSMIEITPQYILYDAPVLKFGASVSSIKSQEKHELAGESEDVLSYNYNFGDHVCLMMYAFENGKLNTVNAVLNISDFSFVGYSLLERYLPTGVENDMFIFLNNVLEKATMAVVLSQQTISRNNVTLVTYMKYPLDSSVKVQTRAAMTNSTLESFFK